jgi:hypothetical protein
MANTHGFFGKANDLDLSSIGKQFKESGDKMQNALLTRD